MGYRSHQGQDWAGFGSGIPIRVGIGPGLKVSQKGQTGCSILLGDGLVPVGFVDCEIRLLTSRRRERSGSKLYGMGFRGESLCMLSAP